MFEVLIYLFENYIDNDICLSLDQKQIITELKLAGFQINAIYCALDWLKGLMQAQLSSKALSSSSNLNYSHAMRLYSNKEQAHIGVTGWGFLLYLEQLQIIDPISREIIIDRLMALDEHEVNHHIKTVIFIVLFNQPNKKLALSLLQDILLMDTMDVLH